MAAQVCALKGCWLKDLKNVSQEEMGIQLRLLLDRKAAGGAAWTQS